MADMSDGGWLQMGFDGDYECDPRCEKISFSMDDVSAGFMHYPDDGHYGWSLLSLKRVIKIKNIWFVSEASYNLFMTNIKTLQDAGAFNIRIQNSTTPSYLKFDGTNHIMPVLFVKISDVEKPYGGDATIYIIPQLILEQAGALASS